MRKNPWLQIPYSDYEAHMSHPNVKQLQLLNQIISEKVQKHPSKSVVVLGAGAGNGFEHFSNCETVYAVDINPEYLEICHVRYGHYGSLLKYIAADIIHDVLPIPEASVDLVICHLILEYTDVVKTMQAIIKMLRKGGVVNIVLQESGTSSFVSPTSISSLNSLSNFATEVPETSILDTDNLKIINYEVHRLTNEKLFKSYDLVKV